MSAPELPLIVAGRADALVAQRALTLRALTVEGFALMWRAPHVWVGLLAVFMLGFAVVLAPILWGLSRGMEWMLLAFSGVTSAMGLLTAITLVPPLCTGWMAQLACERAGVDPGPGASVWVVLWSATVVGIAATVGFQLLIVPGMWAMASMGQAPAVVVCEGVPSIEALTRSRVLSEPARRPLMIVQALVLVGVVPLTALCVWPVAMSIASSGGVSATLAVGMGAAWFFVLNLMMVIQGALSAATYARLRALGASPDAS
jgi:hypothetical protein